MQYKVRFSFSLPSTIEQFNRNAFIGNLSTFLDVPPSTLNVTVGAGSVLVSVVLVSPSASVAAEATKRVQSLKSDTTISSSALGVTVTVVSIVQPEIIIFNPPTESSDTSKFIIFGLAAALVVVLLTAVYCKFGVSGGTSQREARKQTIQVGLGQAIQQRVIEQQMESASISRTMKRPSGVFKNGPPVERDETVTLTKATDASSQKPGPPPGPPPPALPPKTRPPTGAASELAANQA